LIAQRGAVAATTSTGTATPGMLATAARTSRAICSTTSSCAVVGASWTAIPVDETVEAALAALARE